MKTRRIYSLLLAQYLVNHGCECIEQVPDKLFDNRINWIFKDAPNLDALIKEYSENKSKR